MPLGDRLALRQRRLAVDEDIIDADRIGVRPLIGREVAYAVGIEDDHVGESAFAEQAAVGNAQDLRGQAGRGVDRLRHREDRKSGVEGTGVSVRVDLGGRGTIKKKTSKQYIILP